MKEEKFAALIRSSEALTQDQEVAGERFMRTMHQGSEKEAWHKEGSLIARKNSMEISLSYEKADLLRDIPSDHVAYDRFVEKLKNGSGNLPPGLMKLTSLRIENKNGARDLFASLPEHIRTHVYFLVSYDPKLKDMIQMENEEAFVFFQSPVSKGGLLTLAHELGHMADFTNRSPGEAHMIEMISEELSKGNTTLTDKQLALLMEAERNAWAYANKTIKPFMEDIELTPEEHEAFKHDACLGSYARSMKTVIEARREVNFDGFSS